MVLLGALVMIAVWLFVGSEMGLSIASILIFCLIVLVLGFIADGAKTAWRKCEKHDTGPTMGCMLILKTIVLIVALALANLIFWPLFVLMLESFGAGG